MKTHKIRSLSVFLACAGLFCMPARAARLAVIATDTDAGIQSVSDLLGLELGKRTDVEMVERSELDRVLREQNLAAGSLARSGERMSLGRILKADALVLLRQGRAREGAPQQLDARLVETETGYLLGRWTRPLGQGALADAAAALVPEIGNGLRKLGLGRADRILVSVACVFNSTMADEYFWIENEMPGMLENGLMSAERIVALERRDLNNLLTERQVAQWEGGELEGAAVILNGDIRLKSGEKMAAKPEERVVEFTLRIRGNDLKELDRVVETGKLKELEEMTARVVTGVSEILGEIGAELGWDMGKADTKVEAGVFLDLAKRGGWTWAAEAAHALDVKDKAAAQELIAKLSKDAFWRQKEPDDFFDFSVIRERSRKFARAVELCRESGLHPIKTLTEGQEVFGVRKVLGDPRTRLDGETIEILRPVRQLIISQAEAYYQDNPWYVTILCKNAFEDPNDFLLYLMDQVEKAFAGNMTYGRKTFQICQVLFEAESGLFTPWSEAFFLQFTLDYGPEIRMAALMVLSQSVSDSARKKEYARLGLMECPNVFQNGEFLYEINRMGPYSQEEMVTNMLAISPEMRLMVSKTLEEQFERILREDGFIELVNAGGLGYSAILSRRKARELIQLAVEKVSKNPAADYDKRALSMLFHRAEEMGVPLAPIMPETETREILSDASEQWTKLKTDHQFEPSKLLVDDSILWILLSAYLPKTEHRPAALNAGLVKMDMQTGNVLSAQIGALAGDAQPGAVNMCRWDDTICAAIPPVGVVLFPANPGQGLSDLSGVRILGDKNGLTDTGVRCVAGIGDELYIATPRLLMKWNRRDNSITMAATASERTDAATPLGGSGEIKALMPSKDGELLYVLCDCKLWVMTVADQDWDICETGDFGDSIKQSDLCVRDGTRYYALCPGDCERFACVFDAENGSLVLNDDSFKTDWHAPHRVKMGGRMTRKYWTLQPDSRDIAVCPQGTLWVDNTGSKRRVMLSAPQSERDKLFAWAGPDTLTQRRQAEADRLDQESFFFNAVAANDAEAMEESLAQGVNINARSQKHNGTALLDAILAGHTNLAFRLIEKGADISIGSRNRTTPLFAAATENNLPVIRKLVEMGADTRAWRWDGAIPVMAAAWNADIEIIQYLWDRMPSDAKGFMNTYILNLVAQNPHPDVFEFFLKKGGNVNTVEEGGFTPLLRAIETGREENMRLLLDAGANIRAKIESGYDALYYAATGGHAEAIKWCLDAGMPVNARYDKAGWTPLMLAAWNSRENAVRYLIERGADIEMQSLDDRKSRAICYATYHKNNAGGIKALLEAGADITTPCKWGPPIKRYWLQEVLFWHRDLFEKYAKNRR